MCEAIYCNHGVTRRGALQAAAGFAVLPNLGPAAAKEAGAGRPKPNAIGADAALYRLMAGNVRYVANKPRHRNFRRTGGEGEFAISDCRCLELRQFARCP